MAHELLLQPSCSGMKTVSIAYRVQCEDTSAVITAHEPATNVFLHEGVYHNRQC